MEIYTAGFAGWSAEEFFGRLKGAGISRLLDVRLRNTSQLSGFAKKDDLAYFLRELVGATYAHEPLLAPDAEILDAYKKRELSWDEYAEAFLALMRERRVHEVLAASSWSVPTLLLCSEHDPNRCHRRLVIEHLREYLGPIDQVDLT